MELSTDFFIIYVQVCRKVMVGTTGDQKFASLEKIIVPLESVQRDESKYVLFMT